MSRTKPLVFLGIVLAVAVGTYWLQRPGEAGDLVRIKIIDPVEANNLHVPLADSLGFFAEEGLDATVSGTSAGKFAMDALVGDAVDYAVVVEMNVAQAIFEDDDIIILAEIAQPINAIKVLGRRDRGIDEPADLAGKKIGVLYGVSVHLFITRYLDSLGIGHSEKTLINLRPPDAVAAFESGDIDAIITWQPHVFNLQRRLGDTVIVLTDDNQSYWNYKMVIATRRSHYEANPEEARAVLRAILKSDDYIRDHPEESMEILSDRLNLDLSAVRSFFGEIQFLVQISEELPVMIRTEIDWLQAKFQDGKEPRVSDLQSLIADDLRRIRPERWGL